MSQSSGRLAIGSFQAWEPALRVLADLLQSGIAAESAIVLALSGVFSTRPANPDAMRDIVELAFHELGERVCCSAGPLATEIARRAGDRTPTLERSLSCWLSPRQAERVASYVRQRKIVMGVQLTKGDHERPVCLTLLGASCTPVEVHDVGCGHH